MAAPRLTIVTPFSGRERDYWERWCGALRALDCDRRQVALLWLDNSRREEFHAHLRGAAEELTQQYAGVEVVVEGRRLGFNWSDPVLVANQAALLWQRAAPEVKTEFALCLESDVLPPPQALARLTAAMGEGVAAASAVVPYLWEGQRPIWLVGDVEARETQPHDPALHETIYQVRWRRPPPGEPVEEAGAVGFGCLLVRRAALAAASFRTDVAALSYDQQFCREARARGEQVLVDWGLRCAHVKRDASGALFELRAPAAGEPWELPEAL